ncbi:MAG: TIGR03016 family PEP-CTERM system-associated outer membrane protein [Alphaproteobacteria bacterium]
MTTPASFPGSSLVCAILLASWQLLASLAPADAATWRIDPSVSVEESYTDNVLLTPDNEQSDFITSIRPHVNIRGTGARLQLTVDYGLERLFFADHSEGNRTVNNLRATGKAELIQDMFFVDAQAAMNEQFISNRDAVSQSNTNISSNRTTVQTYNLSPYLRHHFGGWADSESRYTFRNVSSGTQDFADTTTNELSFNLSSGRRFGRLGWTLRADEERSNRSRSSTLGAASTYSRRTLAADIRYALYRWMSLVGTYGYERIRDQTLTNAPNGPFWSAGVQLTPGPRSSVRATYGHRFNSESFNLDASYRPTSRTTFTATYSETIQTTQQVLTTDLSFVGVGPDGQLIDTRTGLPFVFGNSAFGLVDQSFRRTRFAAAMVSKIDRNTFNVQAFDETRNREAAGNDENVIGGSVNWNRRLTHKTTLDLGASFQSTEFSGVSPRTDDLFIGNARLNYQLLEDVRTWLTLNRTDRRSTIAANNITENVIAVGLRKDF